MIARWLLVGLLLVSGCTGGSDENHTIDPTRQRLIALGQAYGQIVAKGKAPESLADLTPALKTLGDPEQLTKSPRDGQPFVILWGTRLAEPEPKVFIHEKEGQGGRRFVLMTDGAAFEVPEERFQKMPKVK